jgi:hypothetical protein
LLLARQIEKRTSVPESAMAVAASAYPAAAADDDGEDAAAILRSLVEARRRRREERAGAERLERVLAREVVGSGG